MARSILREPPKGSELAARVAAAEGGDAALAALHPEIREFLEGYALFKDPRLWKHPTEAVARHYVPVYISVTRGPDAAALVEANLCLAMEFAELLQRKSHFEATAAERAREPPVDRRPFISAIVVAEMVNVSSKYPSVAFSRLCELTGQNLGARGAPIDRNTIRRAVNWSFTKCPRSVADDNALLRLAEIFRPGWRSRLDT